MSLSTCLPELIRTHMLPEFPFTCNYIFLCLLHHFSPIQICRSRHTQNRKWFYSIQFIAVLQSSIMRLTIANAAIWSTHNATKEVKHMGLRQAAPRLCLRLLSSQWHSRLLASVHTQLLTCFPCDLNIFFYFTSSPLCYLCLMSLQGFLKCVPSKLLGSIHLALRKFAPRFLQPHISPGRLVLTG